VLASYLVADNSKPELDGHRMHKLNIVFLGFGRMGRAAFVSLNQITDRLRQEGIDPYLRAVFEADENLISILPDLTGAKAVFVDTRAARPVALSDLLHQPVGLRADDEFLIYDATPSTCHLENLVAVCEHFPQAIYLGEKPLFTRRSGLIALNHFGEQILCDFVDSQNQAVLKLLAMQRGSFRIERLRFWRLNSSGLQKLLAPQDRRGIEGGALLDKGIHDIALAAILMRNQQITGASWTVREATNLAFMPPAPDSDGLTDAAGYARIESLGPPRANAEFHYSWIGVERFDDLSTSIGQPSLRALLNRHGLEEPSWLWRTPGEEEARIALVEGTEAGRDARLVVNLLSRPGIQPFVFHAEREEFLDLSFYRSSESPLARVLNLAIHNCVNRLPLSCSPLGAAIIAQAHQACFDIRDQALVQQPHATSDWMQSECILNV